MKLHLFVIFVYSRRNLTKISKNVQELIYNVFNVVWLGSTDDQIMITKRHGPLFHLLLSTMEKYEPDIELSSETTTQISTDSTANFLNSDGKNDFHF